MQGCMMQIPFWEQLAIASCPRQVVLRQVSDWLLHAFQIISPTTLLPWIVMATVSREEVECLAPAS